MINCTFSDNTSSYEGGGMANWDSYNPKVANCTFSNNSAYAEGGGMSNLDKCSPTVTNCTFSNNSASNNGGGMCNEYSSNPTVTNCIFWNDTPDEIDNWQSSPTVTYSCVKGGYTGTGNINADPLFVDPLIGDYHLTFPSPCWNTGNNSVVTEPIDFEDDPRIAYGAVDMGADEFYTHLYWTGDATPGGNVAFKFVGLPGTSPVQLWLGSGVMDPPMPTKYGDWHLQFPLLANLVLGAMPSPDGVMVLPFTLPADIPVPLTLPFQAGIGVELTNLSVMEVQ